MARIRTIKPEFWSDATISKLSIFTQLFYVALWNFADDAGRGRANAKELNGIVFSKRDDVENSQVEAALLELAEAGRILLYTDGDDRLFQICKWAQHQVINKPSRSRFPAAPGHSDTTYNNVKGECSSIPVALPEECSSIPGTEGGIWKAEGGRRNLDLGRRKAEGGAEEEGPGETADRSVMAPQEPPAPPLPSAFLEQAPVPPSMPMPSEPEKPQSERVITVSLTPEEWQDLLASGPPGGSRWVHAEIWDGLEILSERERPPRDAAALLHSKLLPEVRAGTKKPSRLTANGPPSRAAPIEVDHERIAQLDAEIARNEQKRLRALAMIEAREKGEQANATANR